MKILKILLLIILSLFLAIYSLVFMLGFGLEKTVFNINHYRKMSQEFNVFSQLHENMEAGLLAGPEGQEQEMDEQGEKMMMVFREVFDEQWLEEQFLVVTEDVFSYTKGETDSLTATIDLTDRKELLEETIMEKLIQEEGLTQAQAAIMSEGISKEIELPKEIHLEELLEGEEGEDIDEVLSKITMVRQYFLPVSALVFVVVFVLILLLAKFPVNLKWYGASMLIPAVLLLIAQVGFNSVLDIEFVSGFADIPTEFGFVVDLVKYTLSKMYIVPIAYSAIAVLFISSGIILGKKREKSI